MGYTPESEKDGRALLVCQASRKKVLLQLLVDLPVEIESVRRRTRALEDLYMHYTQGADDDQGDRQDHP